MFQNDGSFIEKFKRLQELKANPQEVAPNPNNQFSAAPTTNSCIQSHSQGESPILQSLESQQVGLDMMTSQQCILGQQPPTSNFQFNPSLTQSPNQFPPIAHHQFPVQQQMQQSYPPPVNLPMPISNNQLPLQFNVSQSTQAVPPPVILPPSALPITTCSSTVTPVNTKDEDEYDPMNPTDGIKLVLSSLKVSLK